MTIACLLEAGHYRKCFYLLASLSLTPTADYRVRTSKSKLIAPTHLDFDKVCADLPLSIFGIPDRYLEQMGNEEPIERYTNRQKIEIWQSIITHYGGCGLSVFEDRLPALAGITSELSKCWGDVFMMGDKYVAGFWQETLIQHLVKGEIARQAERSSPAAS